MNCEGPYLAEGFLHTLCPCFDIAFAPLGVITRINNGIVKTVAAQECYLIIIFFKKNRESKKQLFRIHLPVKLTNRKISMKKEKISSYLIYNITSFSKIAGKIEFFFRKSKLNMNL